MKKYDYIVLGSGPGGSSAALGLAREGHKVAVVDPIFGGTCALRGCTPKKAMESVTSTYWASKDFEGKGFASQVDFLDWSQLVAHKSTFTTLVPSGTKNKFHEADIDTFVSKGKFIDSDTIEIDGEKLQANKFIIATGAKPRDLSIDGAQYMINSYDFFELDHLPQNIVIVGGGYIAFELSHIAAACGANVTIVSRSEMPFEPFDSDLVEGLVQATLHKGIDVRLGYEAVSVEKDDGVFKVRSQRNGDKEFTFHGDLVINAAGRVPNTSELGLDNTDVQIDEKNAVIVDEFLSANKDNSILAIGDVTGQKPFTEAANYEADILLYNEKHQRRQKLDYFGMPIVVYTYPKMAMVGKCERTLEEENANFDSYEARLSNFFTQRAQANRFARYKTCVETNSDEILGAHLLGCGVEEIINLFGMAMQTKIKSSQLEKLLLAYPTATHDIKYLFKD